MKSFKLFLFAALAVFFVACKNSINPASEKIEGPLGDYFEIVPKDYKIEGGKMTIEFIRVKEGMPDPWQEGMSIGTSSGSCAPAFRVEFYDGDGNVVCKDSTDLSWDSSELDEIVSLSVSDIGKLTFDCLDDKGIKSFKVFSTFEAYPDESSDPFGSAFSVWGMGSDSDGSSDETSSSEDWDAVLDSYDSYVTEYIDFVERAKNNPSVLAESASLVKKAQDLGDKLEKAQDEMSSSQVDRYVEISKRMAEAAASLYHQ